MTAIVKTEAELRQQRADLLAKAGMTEALLFERGRAWELYPEHRALFETIRSIDWLLGEDKAHTG